MSRLLLLVAMLAGCESSYIIDGKVTVDPLVAPSTAATVAVIVEGRKAIEVDWTATVDSGGDELQPFAPGTLGYTYRYETFGESPHALYLAAFIDLNNNGALDHGEPLGEFAGNPIIDAPWGTVAPPTTADIAIDGFAP